MRSFAQIDSWKRALPMLAACLLAGCATRPLQAPDAPVVFDEAQARRNDAQRAAITDWTVAGRVAISNGRDGGSGRLDWTQRGDQYDISLAAPVTRRSWRLSGDAQSARLEGVEGGPRESTHVEELLQAATGWHIPVRAMVDWVRAVAAPADTRGEARVEYGTDALPTGIAQAGWQVDYSDWYDAGAGQPAMPRRIEARRGEARVRLVVDGWTLAPQPDAAGKQGPLVPGD